MDNGFRADSAQIQEQLLALREQQRQAEILCDQLQQAQSCASPEHQFRFAALLQRAQGLARYFREMTVTVDNMEGELAHLSQVIGRMLEDAAVHKPIFPSV